MGWLFGAYWEVDPADGRLQVCQTWCARAFRSTDFETASRARRFPAGEGLPGRVWAERTTVWIEDVQADDDFPRHAAAACEGLHAAVAFPAHFEGVLYGVIEFYTDALRSPSPALLPVFERLGEEIGRFIAGHNAAAGPESPGTPCSPRFGPR